MRGLGKGRERERESLLSTEVLVFTTVRADKPILCRTGQQPRDTQGRNDVVVLSPKTVWRKNSFFLREPQSFLLRSGTEWVRPPLLREGYLLTQSLLI